MFKSKKEHILPFLEQNILANSITKTAEIRASYFSNVR